MTAVRKRLPHLSSSSLLSWFRNSLLVKSRNLSAKRNVNKPQWRSLHNCNLQRVQKIISRISKFRAKQQFCASCSSQGSLADFRFILMSSKNNASCMLRAAKRRCMIRLTKMLPTVYKSMARRCANLDEGFKQEPKKTSHPMNNFN